MDEFGLDEERFFALSSPEDDGGAAGASPGGHAERAIPCCSGPGRAAPWDAADILVPPAPAELRRCSLQVLCCSNVVCITYVRSGACSMRLLKKLLQARSCTCDHVVAPT